MGEEFHRAGVGSLSTMGWPYPTSPTLCDQVGYGPGDVRQIDLDSPRFGEVARELRESADDTTDAARADRRWAQLAESLDAVA
jgi:hypothetical protein